MFNDIWCFIIKIINFLTNQTWEWIMDILIWCLSLLPRTPFMFEPIQWGDFGSAIGYYVPLVKMFTHLGYALVAIAGWYAIQHIMRVLKMIR